MVRTIKYSTTQVGQLSNIAGKLLYDSTTNTLKFNNTQRYGTIVSQDENGYLSGVSNININGLLGVNTSSPDRQLEVNSSTGSCMRLTYDDNNGTATYYADFTVSAAGALTIDSSGNVVNIDSSDSLKVLSHDGATKGLYLGNTLVTATAAEINVLTDIVNGTAAANKALVLDTSLNISSINSISAALLTLTDTTASTSSITGALKLSGGLGIDCDVDASSSINGGAATIKGGLAVAKKGYFGSNVVLSDSTESTSISSAVLTVAGGIGATKKCYFGSDVIMSGETGILTIANITDASNTSSGAAIIDGGLAVKKKVYVGTDVTINGSTLTKTEVDYLTSITKGFAAASKALVVDANKSIVDINYVETQELVVIKQSGANNNIIYPFSITVLPATTATNGLGAGLQLNSVNDQGEIYNAAYINFVSDNVTKDSETGHFDFKVANAGVVDSIMTISNTGICSAVEFNEVSDIRLKRNIIDTSYKESMKILDFDIKNYNMTFGDTKKKHTGMIAQEVKKVFPELTSTFIKDDAEYLNLHYTGFIPHLINCIKQLNEEIKNLKDELKK